jgi:hypothetical protein
MSWNIFNRITALEQEVTDLREQLRHQNVRLDLLRSVLSSPYAAVLARSKDKPVLTEDEIKKEREKKLQYRRDWYAKNVAKKKPEKDLDAIREKRRAYHRAYYARKKGESK